MTTATSGKNGEETVSQLKHLRNAIKAKIPDLFHELIWPAAAGNVAWSFVSVAYVRDAVYTDFVARLVLLFLLAVYLVADWLRTKGVKDNGLGYWFFDALLVGCIVVLAIGTQLPSDTSDTASLKLFLKCVLTAIFIIPIAGHIGGVWEKPGKKNWLHRILLASVTGSGALLTWLLPPLTEFNFSMFSYFSFSLGIVLILWGTLRYLISELPVVATPDVSGFMSRIEMNPAIMLGKPVIRGTHITVESLVLKINEKATDDDLRKMYSNLTSEDICAARQCAVDSVADAPNL